MECWTTGRAGIARQFPFVLVLLLTPVSLWAAPQFEVFPTTVNLQSSRGEQSLVARWITPDGVTHDVTPDVQLSLPPIVRAEGNILRPVADGTAEVKVAYGDQTVSIPVTVKDAATERPISFKLDVMPVFLKAGCNTGGCHGSARGKDGFRLSLFGFDPAGDYQRLTRELSTRRINLAIPQESLVVQKALGKVPHTGGVRFKDDSPLHATLMRWLEAGAPQDPPQVATPQSVEILPRQMLLEEGTHQQLAVRAHYSDGTERDVTKLALFLTNNENSAVISESGMVSGARRGEAFVMARFATFTMGTQVIVIPKGLEYHFPDLPENNYVDALVDNKLKKLRILPSALCSDETFLRRAFLDIVGLLPTREEHDRFVADADSNKRDKLVDELLGRKEFVEMWVMKWAELLQIRSSDRVSYKATLLYYNWLEDKIAHNVPFDQIVRELLESTGGTFSSPATNYYQEETDTLKVAENTAQVFMGTRIQCAQCHNHPFDRWTMDDYYGFAAFFSQVGRKPAEDPREIIVFNGGGGEINHPVGGRVMRPKFLGGDTPDLKGQDRRAVLAAWLASPQNPYFARNLANVVWSHFLGKGIIEPVDDVRVSNPASNPELLEALGQKFQEYHYDFKRLVRDICTSRTYQLSSQTVASNESDQRNFSHALVRRMRAEVLLDCIAEVTETKEKFRGLPLGSRAVEIADGKTSNFFLTTFGRATRETVCSCEVKMEPNLSQALELINGNVVQNRLTTSPVIPKLMAENAPPEKVIDDLYLRCLTRTPEAAERQSLAAIVPEGEPRKQALDDIFWGVLNSQEFIFNH